MKKSKNNISGWLEKHGDPKIEMQVEKDFLEKLKEDIKGEDKILGLLSRSTDKRKVIDKLLEYHDFISDLNFYGVENMLTWDVGNDEDSYAMLTIYREREETEEEYNSRLEQAELYKSSIKKERYNEYLKLKAEFENEDGTKNL